MFRSLSCLLASLMVLLLSTVHAGEPMDVKIIASFGEPYSPIQVKKEDTGVVIRSAQELVSYSGKPNSAKDADAQKKLESEVAKLLKVERIDWTKQMILAVHGHRSKEGSGAIKFRSLKIKDKVLHVTWQQEDRPSLGIANPRGLALVQRFDGEVKFVAPAKK
jgi:hypothetical protein